MFTETMTSSELLDEYCADLSEIQDMTLQFDRSDYITRYLWKRHKQSQVVVTKTLNTSRNNRYIGLLLYTQSGTGKSRQWNMTSFHIGLMTTYRGTCAIAFYKQGKQALKFTQHFFKRYKERFGKLADWQTRNSLMQARTVSDIISVYFKRNLSMTWIETKSVFRDKVHIFGPINDGVALLQWHKDRKLLQANTFVTMDMLDEKQLQMVKYARIYFSLSDAQRKKFRFPDFIQDDESNED